MSLWDQIVKKEHVFLTVEYENRYLNVWRQDSNGYSKFYVTPLCFLELDSISCSRDEYSSIHRHIFGFNIKLWDSNVAKVVQNALKEKNINASLSEILPLPMQMVRIGLGGNNLIVNTDNEWRSNQDQPFIMSFELYTRHEHFCNKMISDAKNNTKQFLRGIKPYFEFMMVVGKHETRNFNLTGKNLQESSFFSQLVNKHADKDGIVYLQSKDVNRLIHDIFDKVAFEEVVSAGYIPSAQEKEIIDELLSIFKNKQIQSQDLMKDEWNSVFWDDIFARPDIQTDYANEVLKYDEIENKFTYDSEKDKKFREKIDPKYKTDKREMFSWFGELYPKGKYPSDKIENDENPEKDEKFTVNFNDINRTLAKESINVKWNGIKFEPKDLTLYRLNTKNLNSSNDIYFKRVIVSNQQTTQKIEIKTDEKKQICPESWTFYNITGFCYKVIVKRLTWKDAEMECVKESSHLISIHSWNEILFATYLASPFSKNICEWKEQTWIGMSTKDNNTNWEWTDGTPFDYTDFHSGEPNNPGQENCSNIWTGHNCKTGFPCRLNNFYCNVENANFICKRSP